ncbi:MAG: SdpI family protein [Roseburia sp.]|nr:SdpI family protein [Roseburia sp.]
MEGLKKYKKTMILTSIVMLLPILVGVLLWDRLPEQVATHFDFEGNPNGWTSRGFTVFGIPLFLLVCQWIAAAATLSDPKHKNLSEKVFKLILWLVPIVSLILVFVTYGYALGYETSEGSIAFAILGIFFIVIGNYLPKCRQNYTVGIKIPWTLHDEENWNHTHRMAGYLWMLGGLIILANIFLKWDWLFPVVLAVAVLVPTIYSYLYYRKHGCSE